jgi:hypothetical protein
MTLPGWPHECRRQQNRPGVGKAAVSYFVKWSEFGGCHGYEELMVDNYLTRLALFGVVSAGRP